jgi:hypothetical protein
VISCNGAAIVNGTKVFASITAASFAAYTGGAQTVTVGQGSIMGTSHRVIGLGIDGMVYVASSGRLTGVQETTRPVKTTTASVYGVTFNSALAAANTYELRYQSDQV